MDSLPYVINCDMAALSRLFLMYNEHLNNWRRTYVVRASVHYSDNKSGFVSIRLVNNN